MANNSKIIIQNKRRQGIPILLTDSAGKLRSWMLPSRGSRVINMWEHSQDLLDKAMSGYITVEELVEE